MFSMARSAQHYKIFSTESACDLYALVKLALHEFYGGDSNRSRIKSFDILLFTAHSLYDITNITIELNLFRFVNTVNEDSLLFP